MKKLLLSTLLLALCSCFQFQQKGIVLKIENASDYPINHIKIATTEQVDSVTFNVIAPKDYKQDFLDMTKNNVDGSFTISYMRHDGAVIKENHGYYSNGSAAENWIKFTIRNDSTLVNHGDFKVY